MRPSVAIRTAHDQQRSLVVWIVGLAALVGLYVAVYPTIKGNATFARIIDDMPKAYRALFATGGSGDFTTPAGYLNVELFTFMGPLLVLIYAITAGAGAIAGEEDRGTLDVLLANPVSRTRVVFEKFTTLAGGLVVLMVALWLALLAEGRLAGLTLPLRNSAAVVIHLGLLGAEFGALALLVGAVTGHIAASRAIPALVAVSAYLLNGLAPLVHWLNPIRKASPFYQYIGHDPLRNGISVAAIVVALASTAALVAAAAVTFSRRDVHS